MMLPSRGYLAFASLGFLIGACAGAAPKNPDGHVIGGSGGTRDGGIGLDRQPPPPPACGTDTTELCTDFPAEPQLDTGVTGDPGSQFSGDPPASGGPCVMEPEDGAMYPNNWARPRIRWTGAAAGTLTKLIFECDREANPMVAYTTASEYKIPKNIWDLMRQSITDSTDTKSSWVTVTVWPKGGGASKVRFLIAPVDASGSMVFWAAKASGLWSDPKNPPDDDSSYLLGFAVGDEGTAKALNLTSVKMQTQDDGANSPRSVRCIGCHTSTPDGKHVAFTDHWAWPNAIAAVEPGRTGDVFPGMTAGGAQAVSMNWQGIMTFSPAHWSDGDFTMVSTFSNADPKRQYTGSSTTPANLIWVDVAAPTPFQMDPSIGRPVPQQGVHFGYIARNGDANGAGTPAWSKGGGSIAYASTKGGNMDGRLQKGPTDIYLVPYNNRAGGDAVPLPGAATTQYEEFYPAWSPDDQLIAFTRVPSGEVMYANAHAEIAVVSLNGGDAVRLAANDPPKCSGKASPGVNNHWPKWSPEVKVFGQRTYYWLIFSSTRMGLPDLVSPTNGQIAKTSQLYMTGVISDETGVHGFPAVYLWNQPTDSVNTTPAWDTFTIPPVQ